MSDHDPIAARHVFWALQHLHMAGARLSNSQHEYIDSVEAELCAVVKGKPVECGVCGRVTPSCLFAEAGADGRCPFCREEQPSWPEQHVTTGPTDNTNYALMVETYPGLPIEEAFSSYVEVREKIGMLQAAIGTVIQAGGRVPGDAGLLRQLREAHESSKVAMRTLSSELFKAIKAPGEFVPGTQLPRAIALGLVAYQLHFEAGQPTDVKPFRRTIEKLDLSETTKSAVLAAIDMAFGS